jgi:hypothetical protein
MQFRGLRVASDVGCAHEFGTWWIESMRHVQAGKKKKEQPVHCRSALPLSRRRLSLRHSYRLPGRRLRRWAPAHLGERQSWRSQSASACIIILVRKDHCCRSILRHCEMCGVSPYYHTCRMCDRILSGTTSVYVLIDSRAT